MIDYIQTLVKKFPNVEAGAIGAADDYESLVWTGGDPLPSKEQLDAARLEVEKEETWKKIQDLRDAKKAAGVQVGPNWFHSDDTSRIQQLGLVMFGMYMPPNIMWKTMQGTFVPMTPTLAMQIFQAVAAKDQALFAKAEQHRAAMVAAPDPLAYDYTTDWPITYAESPEAAAAQS